MTLRPELCTAVMEIRMIHSFFEVREGQWNFLGTQLDSAIAEKACHNAFVWQVAMMWPKSWLGSAQPSVKVVEMFNCN